MASTFPSLEGKYEVLEKLHEGGMGAVYRVRHRLLDEVRVIKVMRPQFEADEALRARFLREAQMAVKLRHPNIAHMFDFAFDDSGRGFIVMEYVDGISLQQLIERVGAPSLGLSLELARQGLTAIGFLHRKGIVHRDISPDNVMATRNDDGKPLVKLIDLGIAKALAAGTGLTGTGTFLGKLRYASPEQFGVEGAPIGPRSDLYSFGVVLYELFTGKHPIPGESPQEIIAGHLVKPPLDFATSDPERRVPEDLRAIVRKALAKKPEDRFPSAETLDQALASVQARFPLDAEEFAKALVQGSEPTIRIRVPAPGSTQERINAQFGLGATPGPVSLHGSEGAQGTAAPISFPSAGTGSAVQSGAEPAAAGGGASPAGTQPTLILPEGMAEPAVVVAVQAQAPGAPRATARRGVPWPMLIGAGVVVVVVALIAARGMLGPRPATNVQPQPPSPVTTPQAGPAAEGVLPAHPTAPAKPAADVGDLVKAIGAGSIEQVRSVLTGLSREDRTAIEGTSAGKQQLDLGRRAIEADSALAKATKAKDWPAAVQYASSLAALLPASREAKQAREAAAASLEAEADALVRKGQGDAALAKLQTLHRVWPDRPGLEARIAGVRSAHEADQRFAAVLAAADGAEKERRPERGLEALEQVTPDARWQERFNAARLRLEGLLSELDKAPPSIRLKPGFKLDYSKGKTVMVQLVVTDDYRVKTVTLMARPEGAAAYQAMPMNAAAGDEYTVELTPEFHGNKTVDLYAVAVDYAGHTSRLAGPDQPLRLKKRWLF